ncbi:SRPBCC family protein [Siccirubricoccus sp. KC 17139]|uniref:SRPBCC family protein n=1 Tax=Siccirubricoccus soli TaxID=2899147 RepID=A0ABT1D0Y4_9PROT|nr:SRPBCC family protein [Siccirubricoccus soli]MCO6415563.1 SRPBCC family protein [Siccirubricoccus soli]MCP2681695.1 SRPBCC family protein [Siccirubricoccus soli]
MTTIIDITPEEERELVLGRILAAPRALLWRCWTEPALLKRWFCPAPWQVTEAEMEVRTGGRSRITMRGPNGEGGPMEGLYLEVVPGERLVFTDAFTAAWKPSAKPFMVATVTFEDAGAGTRYIARCGHWSVEDRQRHETMGFHEGWGKVAEQLEATAHSLQE